MEEYANIISHALGFFLSAMATLSFVIIGIPSVPTWALLVFGLSMCSLYFCSTTYHAVRNPRLKSLFHILDHASIFAFIAGTYTAYCWRSQDPNRLKLMITIWVFALLGVIAKLFWTGKKPWISTFFYLAMGWMILVHREVYLHIPAESRQWLFYGGVSYSLGALFYLWKHLHFHHFIWHLWVLLGSALHVVGLWV
jgi:hemolysin III